LFILVLVVIAFYIFKDLSANSTEATPTLQGSNFLVTQADGTLVGLHIYDQQNHSIQMQRDTNGTWIVTQPTFGTADQSLAAAAETQVGALRIVTTLDNQLDLLEAGLNSPAYSIELTFVGGENHVIQVGMLTPTKSGYYVRYDGGSLYVVSQPGIDALLNLLVTPPFSKTTTPLATFEETITPTLETARPTP
jgi:hypothetical protein